MRFVVLVAALFAPVSAMAEDSFVFEPTPLTVTVDGAERVGVLIDEATAAELVTLRAEVEALRIELDATTLRLERQLDIEKMTIEALRGHQDRELSKMQDHYMLLLEQSNKRTFRERHGLEVGIGIGIVGTVAAIVATGYVVNIRDDLP